MTPTDTHTCKSCGNQFTGYYCNLCGEKVILPQDRSLKTFLSGILIALTFADSKFFKSISLVVLRPGFLSKEFAEGRRVNYLRPMSLFFLLNLVYFIFPIVQLFNATLRTQLNSFHGKYGVSTLAAKMTEMGIRDIGSFALVYDQKTGGLAKMLVIVYAILVSLPLNLIYRTRNRYFTDHVGLSVELVCFNLFINALLLSLITGVFGLGAYVNEVVLTTLLVTTNLYFIVRSGITFYEDKGFKLVLRSLLMLGVLKIALEAYRAILFYVTLWSL
ncbi:MAG: DUF3667 domain-containing protein [Cyclobacteriaceae bacterium]|nr:DUF3667 domain-containing protein [Cyclobacteriaceae bacterium]